MSIGLLAAAVVTVATPQGGVLPGEQVAYDKELAAKARLADQTFMGWCANTAVQALSATPWSFPDLPGKVTWREKVRVSGCGHSSLENLNVARTGGAAPWWMTFDLPGQSLAGLGVQRDAFHAAATNVKAEFRTCQELMLSDVYVTARPGGIDIFPPGSPFQGRKGRPAVGLVESFRPILDKLDLAASWEEVWPINACGHDRTFGVVFMPYKDGKATAYLFLPLWQMVEKHGPGSLPLVAPPVE